MDTIGKDTLVVGIDGSVTSDAALVWAVDEASRRGLGLHLVSAGLRRPRGQKHLYDADDDIDAAIALAARETADAHLSAAVEIATGAAPGLVITHQSALDGAAGVLVELSARARCIVVGRSSHGPVMGAVLGSVASQVVTHAQCSVVVVHRADATGQRGVAVGVDGSAGSELALAEAFEQASRRGTDLHVIHAWWTRATAGQTPDIRADLITRERLTLAEAMAGWSEHYPDVDVRLSLPMGATAAAITDAARGAELLVVGSRGHGGFRSLLLGSVSHGVLAHAPCTVVVVRAPQRRPGRSVTFGSARPTTLATR